MDRGLGKLGLNRMIIWYLQDSFKVHERHGYRWPAMAEAWKGHKFQPCDASNFRTLRKRRADIAFVSGPITHKLLKEAGINLRKQVKVSCYFGGGAWRRSQDRHFRAIKDYDIIFLTHDVHYKTYRRKHPNVHVVIHGFNPKVFYPSDEERTKGIFFCGNYGAFGRLRRLEKLAKKFPGQVRWAQGMNHKRMAAALRATKIGWNQIAKGPENGISCNLRVWEVLGSGAMLLCSYSKHVPLRDGIHCVLWHNNKDMIEKARYYLEHDEEREKIARQGYEEAISRHTWDIRGQTYRKIVERYL